MKAPAKRGRPAKEVTLETMVRTGVNRDTLSRIEAFQSAQTVETAQAAVIRHLILKGLDAVEKEAANG